MIVARSRPRGPLLHSLFRKPCRFTSGIVAFLGPASLMLTENPLSGLLITGRGFSFSRKKGRPKGHPTQEQGHRTTDTAPHGHGQKKHHRASPSRPRWQGNQPKPQRQEKQTATGTHEQKPTGKKRQRGQQKPPQATRHEKNDRPGKPRQSRQQRPQSQREAGKRQPGKNRRNKRKTAQTSRTPPKSDSEKRAGNRHRPGHPPRFPPPPRRPADKAADGAGLISGPPAQALVLALSAGWLGGFPAPWAGVPLVPLGRGAARIAFSQGAVAFP